MSTSKGFIDYFVDIETSGLFFNYMREQLKPGMVQMSIYEPGSRQVLDIWTDFGFKQLDAYLSKPLSQQFEHEEELIKGLMTMDQPWQAGILTIQNPNRNNVDLGTENVLAGVFRRQFEKAVEAHAKLGSLVGTKKGGIAAYTSRSKLDVFGSKVNVGTLFGVDVNDALSILKNTLITEINGKRPRLIGWNFSFDIGFLEKEAERLNRTDVLGAISDAKKEGRIFDLAEEFHKILYSKAYQDVVNKSPTPLSLIHRAKNVNDLSIQQLEVAREDVLKALKSGAAFPLAQPGATATEIVEYHPGFHKWLDILAASSNDLDKYEDFLREVFIQTGEIRPDARYRGIHFQSFRTGEDMPLMKYVGLWSLDVIAAALGYDSRLTRGKDVGIANKQALNQLHDSAVDDLFVARLKNILDATETVYNATQSLSRASAFEEVLASSQGPITTPETFWTRLQHFGKLKAIEKQLETAKWAEQRQNLRAQASEVIRELLIAARAPTVTPAQPTVSTGPPTTPVTQVTPTAPVQPTATVQPAAAPVAAVSPVVSTQTQAAAAAAAQSVVNQTTGAQIQAVTPPNQAVIGAANAASVPKSKAIGQLIADFATSTFGKVVLGITGLSFLAGLFRQPARSEIQTDEPYLTTAQIAALPDVVRGSYLHGLTQTAYFDAGLISSFEVPLQGPKGTMYADAIDVRGIPIEIKSANKPIYKPVPDHVRQLQRYILALNKPYGKLQYVDYKSGPGIIREFMVGIPGLRSPHDPYHNTEGINISPLLGTYDSDFGSGRSWIKQLGRAIYLHNQQPSHEARTALNRILDGHAFAFMHGNTLAEKAAFSLKAGIIEQAVDVNTKNVSLMSPELHEHLVIKRGLSQRSTSTSTPTVSYIPKQNFTSLEFVSNAVSERNVTRSTSVTPPILISKPARIDLPPPVRFPGRGYQPDYLYPEASGMSLRSAFVRAESPLALTLVSDLATNSMFVARSDTVLRKPLSSKSLWLHGDPTLPRQKPDHVISIPTLSPGIQGPWNTQLRGIRSTQLSDKFPFGSQADEEANVAAFSGFLYTLMLSGVGLGISYGLHESGAAFLKNIGSEVFTTSWSDPRILNYVKDLHVHLQLRYRLHPSESLRILNSVGLGDKNPLLKSVVWSDAAVFPGPDLPEVKLGRGFVESLHKRSDVFKQFRKHLAANQPVILDDMAATPVRYSRAYASSVQKIWERLLWASGGPEQLGFLGRALNLFGSSITGYGFDYQANVAHRIYEIANAVDANSNPRVFVLGPNVYNYEATPKTLFGSKTLADIKNEHVAGFFTKFEDHLLKQADAIKQQYPQTHANNASWIRLNKMASASRSLASGIRRMGAGGVTGAALLSIPMFAIETMQRSQRLGGTIGTIIPAALASSMTLIGGMVGGIALGAFGFVSGIIGGLIGVYLGSTVGDIIESVAGVFFSKPSVDPTGGYESVVYQDPYRRYYQSHIGSLTGDTYGYESSYGQSAFGSLDVDMIDYENIQGVSGTVDQAIPVIAPPGPGFIHSLWMDRQRSRIRDQRSRLGLAEYRPEYHVNRSRIYTMQNQ